MSAPVACAQQLIDVEGQIAGFHAAEHDQQVPQFGWSQQRPSDWWNGVILCIRSVLEKVESASARIAAVACCGQMHGTVLLDESGAPVVDYAPLWNDKRTRGVLDEFLQRHDQEKLLPITGIRLPPLGQPSSSSGSNAIFPKFIGARVRSSSSRISSISSSPTTKRSTIQKHRPTYLYDVGTNSWSTSIIDLLGLNPNLLPELKSPIDIVGTISKQCSEQTGLLSGTPVAVGAGDFPVTLLGSGVSPLGVGSDSTGTSTLLTLQTEKPVLHPIISNVAGIDQGWSAFTILDGRGDAMRWARRAFHDNELSYDELVKRAGTVAPGSDGLLFLPYLNGERLGPRTNARPNFSVSPTVIRPVICTVRSWRESRSRRGEICPSWRRAGTRSIT